MGASRKARSPFGHSVHRTKVVLTEFPQLLLILWREQHPEGHEQTYLDFNVRKPPAESVPLNLEPARKD